MFLRAPNIFVLVQNLCLLQDTSNERKGARSRKKIRATHLLHTHPPHSQMGMGSLCAFIFFRQALVVH